MVPPWHTYDIPAKAAHFLEVPIPIFLLFACRLPFILIFRNFLIVFFPESLQIAAALLCFRLLPPRLPFWPKAAPSQTLFPSFWIVMLMGLHIVLLF